MAVAVDRSVLGAWWRWRSEIACAAGGVSGFAVCWQCIGLDATGMVLGVPAAAALGLPWSRRWLAARVLVLFTRHRLQRAFWELRLLTRAGRMPLVPLIFATPVGVRAWVVLRAGMTFADFEESADAFAVACGARDCRVTASPRWSQLLFIDVMRRDVLGPARVVRSPLADLPGLDGGVVPEFQLVPPAWPEAPLFPEEES
jgi:hypothetical protein